MIVERFTRTALLTLCLISILGCGTAVGRATGAIENKENISSEDENVIKELVASEVSALKLDEWQVAVDKRFEERIKALVIESIDMEMKGPQGVAGPSGPQGPQGPSGPPGASGTLDGKNISDFLQNASIFDLYDGDIINIAMNNVEEALWELSQIRGDIDNTNSEVQGNSNRLSEFDGRIDEAGDNIDEASNNIEQLVGNFEDLHFDLYGNFETYKVFSGRRLLDSEDSIAKLSDNHNLLLGEISSLYDAINTLNSTLEAVNYNVTSAEYNVTNLYNAYNDHVGFSGPHHEHYGY